MWKSYLRWNERSVKWLWCLVILGVLAALPVAYERFSAEQNEARQVEFVFDYRDLLEISDLQTDPHRFVLDQLNQMKNNGIHSLAVYEATLNELKLSRRIELYSSYDARALTQLPISPNENYTYLIFANEETEARLKPIIVETYAALGASTRPWTFKNQSGLIIEMSLDKASLQTMDPDPMTLDMLKEQGFEIVVRLSNRRPFEEATMDRLLAELSQQYGVKRFIIDGETVPGFVSESEPENLDTMGELMQKHNIGLAVIELQKLPQRGFSRLAKKIDYNVVRLHSYTENDGQKLTENLTEDELKARIRGVSDRLVLAVKDRNIRMVFLNARAVKNVDKGMIFHPLDSLYEALTGPEGALERIEKAGYTLGVAEPFQMEHSSWQKGAKALLWLGAVAFMALTAGLFFRELVLALFGIGLLGSAGLFVLNASLFEQAMALGASTCAPAAAIIMAVQFAAKHRQQNRTGSRWLLALWMLVRATAISAIGICFIVGFLNEVTYSLVLQQFRGVSVLHLAPIVLVGLYWLLFTEKMSLLERARKLRELLAVHISVLWVVAAVVLAGVVYYYLSRTGNEGQASGLEMLFRSYLENTLGVRPRIKEFMFAHPLFILGAYLGLKYRNAALLLLAGVIGQASIVDTFAHLHTPLDISAIRVVLGLVIGSIIGYVLIIAWEIISRSWIRWAPKLNG